MIRWVFNGDLLSVVEYCLMLISKAILLSLELLWWLLHNPHTSFLHIQCIHLATIALSLTFYAGMHLHLELRHEAQMLCIVHVLYSLMFPSFPLFHCLRVLKCMYELFHCGDMGFSASQHDCLSFHYAAFISLISFHLHKSLKIDRIWCYNWAFITENWFSHESSVVLSISTLQKHKLHCCSLLFIVVCVPSSLELYAYSLHSSDCFICVWIKMNRVNGSACVRICTHSISLLIFYWIHSHFMCIMICWFF